MPDRELCMLRIYGASDDLVELEGYFREEFNAWRKVVTILLTAPSGAQLAVAAEFCGATPVTDAEWVLSVLHSDPRWTYPIRFAERPDRAGDPALILEVPDGTTVEEVGDA
ncbi:hypothetical protein [Nocardia thailandica]|uniref:hypothetical protein n=1 Tax=Nocardia thailandica TaxID=257275 RepID=UPI0002F0D286|nr:hypothetical protein [Nocardia thailandica]